MNRLPYILFISIFVIDYLAVKLQVIPSHFRYFPEILSGLLFVIIIFRAAYTKTFFISPKYLILFSLFIVHVIGGIILNNVHGGAIFLGIRFYFKVVPFFLLHAIYEYSDKQIATQLKVILSLALLQLPVSFYQRFIQYKHLFTGDEIRGTLSTSSAMSIFLISVITVTLAYYLKRYISARQFIILACLLFLPTTINETKGTLVLIPFAIITVLLFSAKDRAARKRMLNVLAISVIFIFIFTTIYSQFYIKNEERGGVDNFFTDPKEVARYLYRGDEFNPDLLKPKKGSGTLATAHVKEHRFYTRIDTMIAPVILMSDDPTRLLIGLGAGNVIPTKRDSIKGEYMHLSLVIGAFETMIGTVLWEMGILGLALYMIFYYMIYRDTRQLSKNDNFIGYFALGWIGVIIIFILSMPYKNILSFNALFYMFWYISGYIACRNFRLARKKYASVKNNKFTRLSKKPSKNVVT